MIGISSISRVLAIGATLTFLAGASRSQEKPPSTPPGSQPAQGTTPPAGQQSTTPPAGQQATTPPGAPATTTTAPAAGQAATTPPAGQAPATTPPGAKPGEKGGDKPPFKPEELEQILAPIALYPDDLLSQILMATTYPLDIVEADRWVKKNKSLKGDAAAKALEKEDWDPAVKSLINLPDLLGMLSEKLDWTQKLGDAFIGQQKEVMDTIQKLRTKAKDAGQLSTNENQKVEVKQEGTTQVIVIESAQPNTVYVPVYNPTVVYGSWAYPAYPPYPYYPPAYGVGMGIAVGFAWGYAWGHCNWGGGDVDINVNRNTNINNNIDRDKYKNRQQGQGGRGGDSGKFKHDPANRKGVPYRDSKTASQFGGRSQGQAAQARDSYRGRSQSPSAGTSNLGGASAGTRPSAGTSNRGTSGASNRASTGTSNRGSSTRSSSGGLSGVSSGGRAATSSSSRGRSSLGSSSGGSRGGGSRGGGGGRGGGGRR